MTNVSWMLLLAELSGRLHYLSMILAFVCVALALMVMIVAAYTTEDEYRDAAAGIAFKRLAVVTLAFTFLAIILPTRTTVHYIAAVEVGNSVLTSPEMGELRQVLVDSLKQEAN
jgi:hypothetical protein